MISRDVYGNKQWCNTEGLYITKIPSVWVVIVQRLFGPAQACPLSIPHTACMKFESMHESASHRLLPLSSAFFEYQSSGYGKQLNA